MAPALTLGPSTQQSRSPFCKAPPQGLQMLISSSQNFGSTLALKEAIPADMLQCLTGCQAELRLREGTNKEILGIMPVSIKSKSASWLWVGDERGGGRGWMLDLL